MPSSLLADDRSLFVLAIALSILISVWCVYANDVVNSDGVAHLEAAHQLVQGNWGEIFTWHGRSLLEVLIALLSSTTGVSVDISLYVLNALLATLVVVSFMGIVREFGSDRKSLVAAMLVVLFHPAINQYRAMAVDDLGYVGFYLLSIMLLLRYCRGPSPFGAVWWLSALGAALLFRLEAIAFLGFFLMFLQKGKSISTSKGIASIVIALFCVAAMFGSAVWWTWTPTASINAGGSTAALPELLSAGWDQMAAGLSDKTIAIKDDYLGRFAGDYASAVLVIALIVIILVETLSKLTPIHALLVGHAAYQNLIFPRSMKTLWYGLLLCNLVVAAVLILVNVFSIDRYSLSLPLTLLLAAPLSLVWLHDHWRSNGHPGWTRNWIFPGAVLLLIATGIKSLDTFTSTGYLKEAGLWLKHNTPTEASLYTNSKVVRFYAEKSPNISRSDIGWSNNVHFIRSGEWDQYDFLAIHIDDDRRYRASRFLKLIKLEPVRIFSSAAGDRVFLFSTQDE